MGTKIYLYSLVTDAFLPRSHFCSFPLLVPGKVKKLPTEAQIDFLAGEADHQIIIAHIFSRMMIK